MQPPFDLNLLKITLRSQQRELCIKAGHARHAKKTDAARQALISGWRDRVSVWIVAKLRAIERAVGEAS